MKLIKLQKHEFDVKGRIKTKAKHEDITGLIVNEDAVLEFEGKPVAIYKQLDPQMLNDFAWAVTTLKYANSTRTSGLKTSSAIFGYSPRIALRLDCCAVTAMAKNFPKQHYIICKYAEEMAKIYEQYLPELFQNHKKVVEEAVMECWRLPNTPFTSGIINKDNHLAYHYDRGNFKNVGSNMVTLKKNCKGGQLLLPEYNTGFECANGSLAMFDGQSLFHGVSPFELGYKGYRYTTVYYSLKAMGNCGTTAEEIERFRKRRVEIERKRLKV